MTNPYEDNPKVRAFIDDIVAVYDKHGLSLSHQDGQGGFIVAHHPSDWANGFSTVKWLKQCELEEED